MKKEQAPRKEPTLGVLNEDVGSKQGEVEHKARKQTQGTNTKQDKNDKNKKFKTSWKEDASSGNTNREQQCMEIATEVAKQSLVEDPVELVQGDFLNLALRSKEGESELEANRSSVDGSSQGFEAIKKKIPIFFFNK